MDLARVRRLAGVLVASQLRSGRSTSDPRSVFGRPGFLAAVDGALFLLAFGAGLLVVDAVRSPGAPAGGAAALTPVVASVLPFLPLVGVGVVLVAGMMFELTTTAKFSGSDAANWLPLSPTEYVAASTAAVAFTYSPAVALSLGALLPLAVVVGASGSYLLAALLSLIALVEGGLLIEMVRSVTQRAGSIAVGRGGRVTLVVRAVVLLIVILTLQLAFNPVIAYGFLERLRGAALITDSVPFFWGTEALLELQAGAVALAAAFVAAQVAFLALLLELAAQLRVRYWVPTSSEIRLAGVEYGRGHPGLAVLGLSPVEAAVTSKDLRGLVRRREMLPTLVVPFVLIVLLFVEGGTIGVFGAVLWLAWVAGFSALLLSSTAVGQERRALQTLLALPLGPADLYRAKATAVLLPTTLVSAVMGAAVGLLFHLTWPALVGLVALAVTIAVVLSLWGLVFAGRYSDFQDRPRPQFVRPAAMLAATGSGMVILMGIAVPGALALFDTFGVPWLFAGVAVGFGGAVGVAAAHFGRTGFDRLFRELPF